MINKKYAIHQCLFLLLFSVFCILINGCTNKDDKMVVAIVDGIKIYQDDVEKVFRQQDDCQILQTKEEITENTITNTVVCEYGKKHGIAVKKHEIESLVEEYKTENLLLYKNAIEIYGKADFESGLENHLLYQKTKEYILQYDIIVNVTENDIKEFLAAHELSTMSLAEKDLQDITSKLKLDKQNKLFQEYVVELLSHSKVERYY